MSEGGKEVAGQEESLLKPKSKLNIATVGSKNRVCLPPQTCTHMDVEQGDHLAFILKRTKRDKKPYAQLVNVKAEHFEIEDDAMESIGDALK